MLSNFQPPSVYSQLISVCCWPNTFLPSLFISLSSASTAGDRPRAVPAQAVEGAVQRPQREVRSPEDLGDLGSTHRQAPAHPGNRAGDTHHQHVLQQLQIAVSALLAEAQCPLTHVPPHFWVVRGFLKDGDREAPVRTQRHR